MEAQPLLKAAVIGSGRIAAEHLDFLAKREDVETVAVCDLSPSLAGYSAKRFGARCGMTDHRSMLAELKPDIVHVCTPAYTHAAIARDCLLAGANVIVEKPISPTLEEFEDLWEIARSKGLLLIEDHNYLFNAPIPEMKGLVDSGELGEVKEVEVRAEVNLHSPGSRYSDVNHPHPSHGMPAGIIHEFITHMCYLSLYFVDSEEGGLDFHWSTALWSNQAGNDLFKYDDLDAVLMVEGKHIHLRFCSNTYPPNLDVSVRCSNGSMRGDVWHPYLRIERPRKVNKLSAILNHWDGGWGLMKSGVRNLGDRLRGVTTYEGLSLFLGHTYDSLREGNDPPVKYEDIAATCRMVDILVSKAREQ